MPLALNCCVVPLAIDGFAGVTAIDTNTDDATVKVVLPVTAPAAAIIWDVPSATPVARPSEVIVATLGLDEDQLAELVRFCVLPSE